MSPASKKKDEIPAAAPAAAEEDTPFSRQRAEGEQFRKKVEEEQNTFLNDRRGGSFIMVGGKRTHESDVPLEKRKSMGLTPLKSEVETNDES